MLPPDVRFLREGKGGKGKGREGSGRIGRGGKGREEGGGEGVGARFSVLPQGATDVVAPLITFPVQLNQIPLFENQNPDISVNVITIDGYDEFEG